MKIFDRNAYMRTYMRRWRKTKRILEQAAFAEAVLKALRRPGRRRVGA
jgi:hypothetical protein